LSLVLGGCGDEADDSDNGSSSTTTDRNNSTSTSDGTTQCGADFTETCAAGQYCSDPTFSRCSNGCLSNANCAGDQTCSIPSGQSVGACQNNQTTPDGPTEQAFCDKLSACQFPEDCSQAYAATSVACHTCVIEENCSDILDFDGACDSACGL